MTYQIFKLPKEVLHSGGTIKAGWKVNFYLTGTSTPTPVYTTSALSVAHTQPVTADSGGTLAAVYLDPAIVYKASVYDQFDVLQYTVDPVNDALISQASIGAALYPRTAAEISAGVTPTSYAYPVGNVLRYGADPTGVLESTTAILNAWAVQKTIYAPTGSYLVDTVTLPSVIYQRTLYGDGPGKTVFIQKTANNSTFVFGTGGVSEAAVEFRDFSMTGLGSGTGNGIYLPFNGGNPPSGLSIKRVFITGYGGCGILDEAGAFNPLFQQLEIGSCLGNQIDLIGGNSTTLISCYMHVVPTSGKAGYRIRSGQCALIGCTGIDGGSYWGIFGSTVADDGLLAYCQPTLISCDMEAFTTCGVLNRTGGVNINTTTIIANNSNVIGVQVDGANSPGYLDKYDATFQINGGSWLNSYPIHQIANGYAPFVSVGKWVGDPSVTYYNDANAATRTMCGEMQAEVTTGRFAKQLSDLYVTGLFRNAYSGAATFSAATTVSVTFATSQPDNQYLVLLGPQANKTFWVSGVGTGGFTINASSASSDTVHWHVIRKG